MANLKKRACVIASTILSLQIAFSAVTPKSKGDAIAGDWQGSSTCVVRPSGCKDEDAFYRFARVAGKKNAYSLDGGKIVSGKVVSMGVMDCSYHPEHHSLECALPNGARLELLVSGDNIQGTMKLLDGTPWRNIKLTKVR